MDQSVARCSDLCRHHVPGGFIRIVVLEYYDGALSGMLRCEKCRADYVFDIIDQTRRIGDEIMDTYALMPVTSGALNEFLLTVPKAKPSWPVWYPRWKEMTRGKGAACIEAIKRHARRPATVIGWIDDGKRIIGAKDLSDEEASIVERALIDWRSGEEPQVDWRRFLGLEERR